MNRERSSKKKRTGRRKYEEVKGRREPVDGRVGKGGKKRR